MKPLCTLLFLLLATSQILFAQEHRAQFWELIKKSDTTGAEKVLKSWNAVQPNDPELYVAYFNYYVQKGKREIISLDKEQSGGESLQLTQKDNPEVVGYMNSRIAYDPQYMKMGFASIDTGIARYPNRLDMRFGKVYMLGQLEDYSRFTEEIIKTIDYSATNGGAWTWTNNEPVEEPKEMMLGSVQDYIRQLMGAGDEHIGRMRNISETVLKYYPDHVESLSNVAVSYLIEEKYDEALGYLLKAENIAPHDPIVLGNIAWCYLQKNDKPNAIKYYELMAKHGDEDMRAQAEERLRELKK